MTNSVSQLFYSSKRNSVSWCNFWVVLCRTRVWTLWSLGSLPTQHTVWCCGWFDSVSSHRSGSPCWCPQQHLHWEMNSGGDKPSWITVGNWRHSFKPPHPSSLRYIYPFQKAWQRVGGVRIPSPSIPTCLGSQSHECASVEPLTPLWMWKWGEVSQPQLQRLAPELSLDLWLMLSAPAAFNSIPGVLSTGHHHQ